MGRPTELPDATDVVHESAPPFFEALVLPPTADTGVAEDAAFDGIAMAVAHVPDWDIA
jgi:hypothetical protein